jgi:predicted GNAT family acetyltransferase
METDFDDEVVDNPTASRFELKEQGHTAYADYRLEGNDLYLDYVFSPEPLRGTGTAGRLMEGIVDIAEERHLRITPICGYAASWLRRHRKTEEGTD